jgi:hypothetical protein
MSGRRGSNPRPTAWKAVALPTELLPHFNEPISQKLISQLKKNLTRICPPFPPAGGSTGDGGGQERIRTSEVERQRIYSPPHLAALEPARVYTKLKMQPELLSHLSESNQRPTDYKSVALPAELKWRIFYQKAFNLLSKH